jgi:hypothetical protein
VGHRSVTLFDYHHPDLLEAYIKNSDTFILVYSVGSSASLIDAESFREQIMEVKGTLIALKIN